MTKHGELNIQIDRDEPEAFLGDVIRIANKITAHMEEHGSGELYGRWLIVRRVLDHAGEELDRLNKPAKRPDHSLNVPPKPLQANLSNSQETAETPSEPDSAPSAPNPSPEAA